MLCGSKGKINIKFKKNRHAKLIPLPKQLQQTQEELLAKICTLVLMYLKALAKNHTKGLSELANSTAFLNLMKVITMATKTKTITQTQLYQKHQA